MMEQEPVEKYKLTKEQMGWTKNYQKAVKLTNFLQGKMAEHMNKASGFRDLLHSAESTLGALLKESPNKPLVETDQQIGSVLRTPRRVSNERL